MVAGEGDAAGEGAVTVGTGSSGLAAVGVGFGRGDAFAITVFFGDGVGVGFILGDRSGVALGLLFDDGRGVEVGRTVGNGVGVADGVGEGPGNWISLFAELGCSASFGSGGGVAVAVTTGGITGKPLPPDVAVASWARAPGSIQRMFFSTIFLLGWLFQRVIPAKSTTCPMAISPTFRQKIRSARINEPFPPWWRCPLL